MWPASKSITSACPRLLIICVWTFEAYAGVLQEPYVGVRYGLGGSGQVGGFREDTDGLGHHAAMGGGDLVFVHVTTKHGSGQRPDGEGSEP